MERALASIPRREDIQIIVVDDASSPDKVDFDKYPGLHDPAVKVVFTKEGGGAGYARNIGLGLAEGEWTLFMDSDDFFVPGFDTLADSHYDDDADIVFFNVTSVFSDTLTYSDRHRSRSVFFTDFSGSRREFCCRYLYTEPWGKMFRTEFLRENDIRFDETPLANDFKFSVHSGLMAGNIVMDDRPLYCVTERSGSLSNMFCSTEFQLQTRLSVYHEVQNILDGAGVKSYPFYKLVNFIYRHRPQLVAPLENFFDIHGMKTSGIKVKTLALRVFFSRYHRHYWSIF